jgi:hypothetical protein
VGKEHPEGGAADSEGEERDVQPGAERDRRDGDRKKGTACRDGAAPSGEVRHRAADRKPRRGGEHAGAEAQGEAGRERGAEPAVEERRPAFEVGRVRQQRGKEPFA